MSDAVIDGKAVKRWALMDPSTKRISLHHLCTSESMAERLRSGHLIHRDPAALLKIVQVNIHITLADEGP